jgi:hypothetical protein
MTSRLGPACLVAAAVFAASACKPEPARRADRVDVIEVAAGDDTKIPTNEPGELAQAAHAFDQRRAARIAAARGQFEVIASQPILIGTLARNLPLTDAARGQLNTKLVALQAKLDETSNLIEGLARVGIDAWEIRNTEMTAALHRLDEARRDAWRALEKAPHIDPSSS